MSKIKTKFTKLEIKEKDPCDLVMSNLKSPKSFKIMTSTCTTFRRQDSEKIFLTANDKQIKSKSVKPLIQTKREDFNYFDANKLQQRKVQFTNLKKQQQVLKDLKSDKDIDVIDVNFSKNQWEQGPSALQSFQQHYKQLNKIKEQNDTLEIPNSHLTNLLLVQQSENIFPNKLGIVKKPKLKNTLNLNYFKYGDKQINALSHGLQLNNFIQSIQLKQNKITEESSLNLLSNLSFNLLNLDLSKNNIGKIGCKNIGNFISNEKTNLQQLNLNYNNLRDIDFKEIGQHLQFNKSIQKFHFENNLLTSDSCEYLSNFIQNSKQLFELYISWNRINHVGSSMIFKQLVQNTTVKVLNFSWNNLNGDVQQIWQNKTLVHLNISNNKFDYNEALQISEALDENHTIYGFHFKGSYGYVDNLGFLIIDNDIRNLEVQQKEIDGVNPMNYSSKIQDKDNCWICDNWQQKQFIYYDGNDDKVFLNPEFENYEALFMGNKTNDEYKLNLMVPPFMTKYFFTVNNHPVVLQDQDILRKPQWLSYKLQCQIIQQDKFHETNMVKFDKEIPIFDQNYKCNISIIPRTKRLQYLDEEIEFKQKWKFEISLFTGYRKYHKSFFIKCFQFDIQHANFVQLIHDETDKKHVLSILENNYEYLIYVYRYYSSIELIGNTYCITNQVFINMVDELHISENNQSDLQLIYTAVTARPSIHKRCPQRGIVRHQFMEALVRIAILKAKKHQIPSIHESLKRLIDDNLKTSDKCQNYTDFRKDYYWTEQIDKILKFYEIPLKYVYKEYSRLMVMPGQKPFMCNDELWNLCLKLQLVQRDQNLGQPKVNQYFCFAQSMQIDEINSDRIFEMSYLEFLEVVARINYYIADSTYEFNQELIEKYQEYKLALKIESFCQQLKIIYGQLLKPTFIYQDKSVFLKQDQTYKFGFYDI